MGTIFQLIKWKPFFFFMEWDIIMKWKPFVVIDKVKIQMIQIFNEISWQTIYSGIVD